MYILCSHYFFFWKEGATGCFHSFVGFRKYKQTGVVLLEMGELPVIDVSFWYIYEELKNKKEELVGINA